MASMSMAEYAKLSEAVANTKKILGILTETEQTADAPKLDLSAPKLDLSSLVDDIGAKHDPWIDKYNTEDTLCTCGKCCEDPEDEDPADIGETLGRSGLNQIACHIHSMACDKGWWDGATDPDGDFFSTSEERLDLDRCLIAEKLLMIHSEISEATEELRNAKTMEDLSAVDFMDPGDTNKPTGFAVELADTIIRILDLAAFLDIDLEDVLVTKIGFNESRSYRHGGKRL